MADQPLRELRALLLGEGELEPTLLLALLPVLPEQLLGLAVEIAARIEDQRFLSGVPIGEAVRGTRLALLKAGNPLGLVYIPFVMASLRMVE